MQETGAELLGAELWNVYHAWPMYSKFFDNKHALPHHLHQMEEHAANVGAVQKPESYFFPRQLNNYGADYPYTFFGLEPGTTKDQVRRCLERWNDGDNGILDLSRAYRLEVGRGGMCRRGCCTRRAACAPMNLSGQATSSRSSSRWSTTGRWIGHSW